MVLMWGLRILTLGSPGQPEAPAADVSTESPENRCLQLNRLLTLCVLYE